VGPKKEGMLPVLVDRENGHQKGSLKINTLAPLSTSKFFDVLDGQSNDCVQ
jgi:hypothetical protein